jgi:arylsulfatase A-like enzyme
MELKDKIDDHDLLIQIDNRSHHMQKSFDDKIQTQKELIAGLTLVYEGNFEGVDDNLDDIDDRLTRLENWQIKSKVVYSILGAVATIAVSIVISIII